MLEHNSAGFRSVPGTALKRSDGKTVYTPPQDRQTILGPDGSRRLETAAPLTTSGAMMRAGGLLTRGRMEVDMH